jgi:cytochrome c
MAGSGAVALAVLASVLPQADADARRGERVFLRCYACHSVLAGEDKLPGPNLACVVGRRAGTRAGFEFSEAMVQAGTAGGLVWSRRTLDAFLADPQATVPGTTMGMPGLPAPDDRRDVIDYLEASSSAERGQCPGDQRPSP